MHDVAETEASAQAPQPPLIQFGCRQRVGGDLSEEFAQDVAADVGEAVVAAVVAVGQLLVVHAEQMENGRVKVVAVDFVFDGFLAKLIGRAVMHTAFHAAAGQPDGKTFGIVVATEAAL